jgi:hypothetical protein
MQCRFCKYPQEIVLKLERPSKVQQIQILTHETKVGTETSADDCANAASNHSVQFCPGHQAFLQQQYLLNKQLLLVLHHALTATLAGPQLQPVLYISKCCK